MTKAQKKLFKSLKRDEHREAFIDMLMSQQSALGKYSHWQVAYAKKCKKKKIKPPKALKAAA
jgi:hypothetical protein